MTTIHTQQKERQLTHNSVMRTSDYKLDNIKPLVILTSILLPAHVPLSLEPMTLTILMSLLHKYIFTYIFMVSVMKRYEIKGKISNIFQIGLTFLVRQFEHLV